MPLSPRSRTLRPIVFLVAVGVVALVLLLLAAHLRLPGPRRSAPEAATSGPAWPSTGQAAYAIGTGDVVATADQHPVPIASLTKIMTALVVLERAPLGRGDGLVVTVTAADVEDTERRRDRSESVVAVRAGESLTERQALLGLLLASANNLAHLLAVAVAGSEDAFAGLMTARARELHLRHTRYVDASGVDQDSRSTAYDQTVLARTAMRNPTFAWLVRQTEADLPTAGRIRTTDLLLGRPGYVGVKTGSTTPAGGCFVFAVRREVDGRTQLVVGAVTGQRGPDLLDAAFTATTRLVDSLTHEGLSPRPGR